MRRPVGVAIASVALALAPAVVAHAGETPLIPAPTKAKSPFKANRPASEPVGLVPDGVTDPFRYPAEPIVLAWTPVPGAVEYEVEVSNTPGFSTIIWSAETDQPTVVPDELLADGEYWWRVKATDQAGTVGLSSRVARFAKVWPNTIAGTVASAEPGGDAVSTTRLNPYLRWDALPGAKEYEVQLAAGDQFGTPEFLAQHVHAPFASPALAGVLADDGYGWRVRARDPKDNPGPWTVGADFTKAWTPPTVTDPADSSTTEDLFLRWSPVPGAESYQVQITDRQYNWSGDDLKVNQSTNSTALTPSLEEVQAKSLSYGNVWWRVRPVVGGRFGTWSPEMHVNWQPPGSTTPTAELSSSGDSDTALMPRLDWSPVTGATIYRVDVAADSQFNNIVESQISNSTSWTPRAPLPDNAVGTGYHWRVVWGAGATIQDPQWMVSEAAVASASFRKQTKVSLRTPANGGQLSEAPLLTWTAVDGAARYEVEMSQDERFGDKTRRATVWGTGVVPGTSNGEANLPDGTWYWRVRGVDGVGIGQTWSAVGRFTYTAGRPAQSAPKDGEVVVASPTLAWSPVSHACGYQLQVGRDPSFKDQKKDTEEGLATSQTALVPAGTVVDGPGRFYWRVRADMCDGLVGQWSPTRSFQSVRPPDFNLNAIPARTEFGRRLVISGQLRHNGATVRRTRLFLERLVWPSRTYRPYGSMRTNRAGRFAFRLKQRRSANYRLVWRASAANPEAVSPFAVTVVPRVSFRVPGRRVVRRSVLRVKGSVFPRRPALLQQRTSDGWETVRRIRPRRARFSFGVRARFEPGVHRFRVLVPADKRRRFGVVGSRQRSVLVYDRFVIRRR